MALEWLKSVILRDGIQSGIKIKNSTTVNDGMGGETHTFAVTETVDGIIRDLTESETRRFDKLTVVDPKILIIDYTANILITSRIEKDSIDYEVKSIKNPNEENHHLECLISVIK